MEQAVQMNAVLDVVVDALPFVLKDVLHRVQLKFMEVLGQVMMSRLVLFIC